MLPPGDVHPVSVPSRPTSRSHLPAQACAPSTARLRFLTCFRDDADPKAEAERAQPLHSRRRGEGPSGREGGGCGGGARGTHLFRRPAAGRSGRSSPAQTPLRPPQAELTGCRRWGGGRTARPRFPFLFLPFAVAASESCLGGSTNFAGAEEFGQRALPREGAEPV